MTAAYEPQAAPLPSHAASLLALANAATTMLASFAGFIVVARLLGADRLGLLALVTAALFPLRFAEFGLAGAASRFIGAYGGSDPKRLVLAVWKTVVPLVIAALTALSLVCLVISPALIAATIPKVDTAAAHQLAVLVWVLAMTQLLTAVASASLIGLQHFRTVYLTGIGVSLFQLSAIVPLVMSLGIAGFVVSQIAGQAIMLLVGLISVWRIKAAPGPGQVDFDRRSFIAFAGQFALNSLTAAMLEPAVKLLFGSHASLKAMGHFEIFWRLFIQIRTVLLAPLEPVCMSLVRHWQDGPSRVASLYGQIFVHSMAVAVALLAIALPIHFALSLVLPELAFQDAVIAQAVGLTMALGFVILPTYYLGLAAGQMMLVALANIVKLTLLGLAMLLPDQAFGWAGALGMIACAYAVGAAAEFALARRIMRIRVLPDRAGMRHGMAALGALLWSLLELVAPQGATARVQRWIAIGRNGGGESS